MERNYSPKQVADALRVSESSIKRWCDRGAIPSLKTLGGHRRIPLDGLLAFLESTNREIADFSAMGLDSPQTTNASQRQKSGDLSVEMRVGMQQNFENALIRGDEKECRRIMIDWYDLQSSFAVIADELIATSFHNIGTLWDRGEVEIFQERRACELCVRLIHEFRRLFPEPPSNAPSAIGGAPSGDQYVIPGQLVEVVLREAGWRATNLGVNLPLATISEAIRRERPNLVWLGVSHLEDHEAFLESFSAFWQGLPRETPLVVGGRQLSDKLRPSLKYTAHCDTLQQLVLFVQSIKPTFPQPVSHAI